MWENLSSGQCVKPTSPKQIKNQEMCAIYVTFPRAILIQSCFLMIRFNGRVD